MLKRLDEQGVIWRRDNGRYYPNESRRLFERRKPYACLIRKLQHWSRMYHAIMSGFSQAFGRQQDRPCSSCTTRVWCAMRTRSIRPFMPAWRRNARRSRSSFHHHESEFGGLLLDDVWLDDALLKFSGELNNAVVVCRTTNLPQLSSVSVDFESSAIMAIGTPLRPRLRGNLDRDAFLEFGAGRFDASGGVEGSRRVSAQPSMRKMSAPLPRPPIANG